MTGRLSLQQRDFALAVWSMIIYQRTAQKEARAMSVGNHTPPHFMVTLKGARESKASSALLKIQVSRPHQIILQPVSQARVAKIKHIR